MASIQKRTNGRWAVRWRDHEDQQRWQTFRTKAEAIDHRKRVEYELLAGESAVKPPEPVTLATYYEGWIDRQVWRQSTVDLVRSHYRCHILPVFGSTDLGDITTADCQTWVRSLCDRIAPSSVHVVAAHLRRLLGDAADEGLVAKSPATGLRLPAMPRSLVVPPTTEQVRQILHRIHPRYRALVELAASTGMRQGELFGLTVDRVHTDRQQIVVDRQLVNAGGQLQLGPPKTRASVRIIPVPANVLDVIDAHLASYGLGQDGFVFSNDRQEPINRTRFSDVWRPAARPAGLPPRQGMHCLRHFYASMLIRAGCSVKVVQARLGHATASETLDTYSHLWADDDDRTRRAVANAIQSLERARE